MAFTLEDFDFELPPEQIASKALPLRSASKMLTVNKTANTFDDRTFAELADFLRLGDVLVLNNTKVFPARLFGQTETGANVEIFLVEEKGNAAWTALAKPARRLTVGVSVNFDQTLSAEIIEKQPDGRVLLGFACQGDLNEAIDRLGRTPLPPYIKRDRSQPDLDRERYQTVFARERGAIAAPTAGLHFTSDVLAKVRSNGIEICEITLHVGYGTFEPVRVDDLSMHRVSPERFSISAETAKSLELARKDARRIIAVGTTTTRTLEYVIDKYGRFEEISGSADLTILPGYSFKAIDGLLTNFHLPKSSLLILVSSFAGHELIMRAYRHAVATRYRFYSYGDCMLIT